MSLDEYRGKFIPNKPVGMSGQVITGEEINSMGYRAPEFDTVSWKDSIVLFGCSNAFGIGLSYDECISSQVEKLTGRPVINLGVPAGSIEVCMLNQLALHEIEDTPYAVVNCWTCKYRTTMWQDDNIFPVHIGNWVLDRRVVGNENDLRNITTIWDRIMAEKNRDIEAVSNKRMANILWKNTRHIEFTFFPDIQKLFKVPFLTYDDFGSDGAHPGPKTAEKAAKFIVSKL